jgi:hypothetical protein
MNETLANFCEFRYRLREQKFAFDLEPEFICRDFEPLALSGCDDLHATMNNSLSQAKAPRSLHLDLASFPCLSTGNDSNVYRIGDQVAKEYHTLSFDEVARYVALQNEAVNVLKLSGYQAEVRIKDVLHLVVGTEAIPVDELALSASGRPLTLSRYVEEPNLEKLLWRPEMFEKYAQTQLFDPMLREFAYDMNDFFWNEYPTRAQDEFHYHVCMLSRLLDAALGVSGCYISKYNVKLRPIPGQSRIDLIITDLALYIDRVTFGSR